MTNRDECRELFLQCKERLLKQPAEYGGAYEVKPHAGSYAIEYHFNKSLSKAEEGKFIDLNTSCRINSNENSTVVYLNSQGLAKILGIEESLLPALFSKEVWEK